MPTEGGRGYERWLSGQSICHTHVRTLLQLSATQTPGRNSGPPVILAPLKQRWGIPGASQLARVARSANVLSTGNP